jgi:hypothetical protein
MGVGKLRSKEESNATAAKKAPKKEEPVSMQDALKARLSRLNK